MRIRYLVPLVMGLLFLVAFVTTERRWQGCAQDGKLVCFSFPLYLSYETWQALDVHWPALEAVTLLQMRPDSITNPPSGTTPQGPRYVVTGLCVVGFWYLIGCWWERLSAGHRLAPAQRAIRRALAWGIGVLGPLSGLSVYQGIRGGWEGPWMTDAGFVTPLALVAMALVELGVLPRVLAHWKVRVALASIVLGLHVWAESAYRVEYRAHLERRKSEKCDAPGAACFTLPFFTSPTIQDALWMQAPVILTGEFVSAISPLKFSFDSGAAPGVRYAMVWVYWYMLVSAASSAWPCETKVYREVRPALRGLCSLVFALVFIAGLVGSAHGAGGKFGLIVGMGIPVYALRRPAQSA